MMSMRTCSICAMVASTVTDCVALWDDSEHCVGGVELDRFGLISVAVRMAVANAADGAMSKLA